MKSLVITIQNKEIHKKNFDNLKIEEVINSALKSVRSRSYFLFWKDREPVRSQKASECKNCGPEPQKTAKNWSKLVVTGLRMNTIKHMLYQQKIGHKL